MPPPGAGSRSPPRARDVERELARAQGARRLLPWALLSALGGGAIGWAAGGGLRAGATIAAVGLVFALFLWTTSIPRCPACGARLARRRGPGGRLESCPACHARFE